VRPYFAGSDRGCGGARRKLLLRLEFQRRSARLPGAKNCWVFAILHKSLYEQALWPKWVRRLGEVVVYLPPGETLIAEGPQFDRLLGRGTVPCIVTGLQNNAEESKDGVDLRLARVRQAGSLP
jgi:hypothetical protein